MTTPDSPTPSSSCCGPASAPAPAATASTSSSCCGPASPATPGEAGASPDQVRDRVRAGYSEIARAGSWSSLPVTPSESSCCAPAESASGGGCCGPETLTPEQVALAVGHTSEQLAQLPAGANMGLSCGNPTALAALKPGETVLDLGSGGGFDCFLAGPRVGASGRVIGVDMTPDMVARARKNLEHYRRSSGLDNVEFRLGEIENIPAGDAQVDVVISNCVLNLSPDKPRTWREIARVLKPGGRVAVSDLVLLRPLPADVAADVEALVGCVAGASLVDDVREHARAAGLTAIDIRLKPEYVAAFVNSGDALYARIAERLPPGLTAADFVSSAEIVAVR